ncbi:MAG: hypothetical protein ACRKFN_10565 [Desulfitobacterium sp.]
MSVSTGTEERLFVRCYLGMITGYHGLQLAAFRVGGRWISELNTLPG